MPPNVQPAAEAPPAIPGRHPSQDSGVTAGVRADAVQLFQTYVDGEARTCGVLVAPTTSVPLLAAEVDAFQSLAWQNPAATAGGKVVIAGPGMAEVYQTAPGRRAERVHCVNAIAGFAAWTGAESIELALRGQGDRVCWAQASIERPAGARPTVRQSWLFAKPTIETRAWRGRRVFVLDPWNPYAIVVGNLPADVTAEAARRELVGDALAAKLAVVTADGEARFYNASGAHGAIPYSGLASLAFAASQTPWFGSLFAGGKVAYQGPSGTHHERLPHVEVIGHGRLRIDLPSIEVDIRPLPEFAVDAKGYAA